MLTRAALLGALATLAGCPRPPSASGANAPYCRAASVRTAPSRLPIRTITCCGNSRQVSASAAIERAIA